MTPHYADDWLTIYGGDCREVLASLPADSVDCVVTSPPYWGLRDYGTATWEGGDVECDHSTPRSRGDDIRPGDKQGTSEGSRPNTVHECSCGAIRIDSQLGLERTPEEYVANMVAVFAEVRRVLKPSGTCWLNLGDSYAGGNGLGRNDADRNFTGGGGNHQGSGNPGRQGNHERMTGLKPKDLVGIPWRVAFALQADGWYLRSDIIWSKPNPMPESVTDRPTKSHEYLFLLTKSARYYFDADAVREASQPSSIERMRHGWNGNEERDYSNGKQNHLSKYMGSEKAVEQAVAGRNIRSVWNIATRPYPGAHFAVFPPELPERCIKAGSSEKGVCPDTGDPWERVVERSGTMDREKYQHRRSNNDPMAEQLTGGTRATVEVSNGQEWAKWKAEHPDVTVGWRPTCGAPWERDVRVESRPNWRGEGQKHDGTYYRPNIGGGVGNDRRVREDKGWRPTCDHDAIPVPAVVLDPFAGSGTVGMVANRLSRRAILIDLNPEYLKQQMKRNSQVPLGLGA